jgi:hypothetical protein
VIAFVFPYFHLLESGRIIDEFSKYSQLKRGRNFEWKRLECRWIERLARFTRSEDAPLASPGAGRSAACSARYVPTPLSSPPIRVSPTLPWLRGRLSLRLGRPTPCRLRPASLVGLGPGYFALLSPPLAPGAADIGFPPLLVCYRTPAPEWQLGRRIFFCHALSGGLVNN